MTLTTGFTWQDLPLETPFGIARGTAEASGNVVVHVADEAGRVGVGGAAPSAYYGEDRASVESVLPDLLAAVADVDDPHDRQRTRERLVQVAGGSAVAPGARAAVDIALHDLACKQFDAPLYRVLGLDPERAPTSSYTVGLADTDRMAERAATAAETYPILKVKLGTDRDRDIVRAVRAAAPETTIRVDANGAWDPATAVEMTEFLADHGVEFVEQPVPGDDLAGLERVHEAGTLPVAADESCVVPADIHRVAESADIAVVKLIKSGGIAPVLEMCHAARACGLAVMLGCMTETNAAIAAAAHLAPLCDYVDLDGSLLLAEDPFDGVPIVGGEIDLSASRAGTGARQR